MESHEIESLEKLKLMLEIVMGFLRASRTQRLSRMVLA